MKLGKDGYDLVKDIATLYTDSASLCTAWQQEFFESFLEKASNYEDETNVSEKQLIQLNRIADIYGVQNLRGED